MMTNKYLLVPAKIYKKKFKIQYLNDFGRKRPGIGPFPESIDILLEVGLYVLKNQIQQRLAVLLHLLHTQQPKKSTENKMKIRRTRKKPDDDDLEQEKQLYATDEEYRTT